MRSVNNIQSTAVSGSTVSANKSRTFLRATLLSPLVCSILAAVGIFGGISSLFAGLICIVVHTVITGDTVFDKTGTMLLIFAIPAILIGSIFVDEIELKK